MDLIKRPPVLYVVLVSASSRLLPSSGTWGMLWWGDGLTFSNKVLCVRFVVRGLIGGSNWRLNITSRNSLITTARSYRSVNPLIPSASSSPIREIASGLLAARSASRSFARAANSCTSNVSTTLFSSFPLCLRRFGLGVMNWWYSGVFWRDLDDWGFAGVDDGGSVLVVLSGPVSTEESDTEENTDATESGRGRYWLHSSCSESAAISLSPTRAWVSAGAYREDFDLRLLFVL